MSLIDHIEQVKFNLLDKLFVFSKTTALIKMDI